MLIRLEDIRRYYTVGTEVVHALNGVSFQVSKGEWVAIIGQSGSGKSTLMNVLGCLDTPTSGRYWLNGKDVSHMSDNELADIRNREIGFIFQTFQLLPRETALGNVELPLIYRGLRARERRERARAALDQVGLAQRVTHRPNELSGGQRQRVAIARALVTEPSILLADEPTGNLDSATGLEIFALFEQLHRAGHTLCLVTHEATLAARCPRAIRLSDGVIVKDGPGPEVALDGRAERAAPPPREAGVRHLPGGAGRGAGPGGSDAQRVGSAGVDARALPFLGLGLSSNLTRRWSRTPGRSTPPSRGCSTWSSTARRSRSRRRGGRRACSGR
jgi:putative ABC transport system ATP-binding protein